MHPFSEVLISLLSPKKILDLSSGEVTKAETKNHRTYKPVDQGLFCERIFGPDEDWKCACGKYKGIKYKYTICDQCGVEINERRVRRERMGHIQLVIPIVHTFYFRHYPNKISNLLGIPSKKLNSIIYYTNYVVIQPGVGLLDPTQNGAKKMDILTDKEYRTIAQSLPQNNHLLGDEDPNKFIAKQGAQAIEMLLKRLDLDVLSATLRHQIAHETSQQRRTDAIKRLKIVEGFRNAQKRIENRPEWMVMHLLLVISPELRPLMLLNNNRFAMSDLTDLYRRIIIRNNRLRRLMQINAPEIILRYEKRQLQESVDALFDNSRHISAIASEAGRPLKSLADNLKGKQGRFRSNLAGKRLDHSGRSVIVCGPQLKLHECGLPKDMALELFKPFIIGRLIDRGIAETVKNARRIIEGKEPVVWDILKNQLKDHPILLNRAPTLHRLGIQAFVPKLIEGKAIQLHPLACAPFNADYDGDTMAVHVPLSQAAIAEAFQIMLPTHNILNPANGKPIFTPSKDMVLGLYYLTKTKKTLPQDPIKGEGMRFYDTEEVIIAYNNQQLSEHAQIKVKVPILDEAGSLGVQTIETTTGRVIFNQYVPKELGFINQLLTSTRVQSIVAQVYEKTNPTRTAQFLDELKDLGFQYCYQGGLSISLDDIKTPAAKDQMIQQAQKQVDSITQDYLMGITTNTERYNQIIDIWTKVNIDLTETLIKELEQDQQGFNSVYMMMDSGARGSKEQIKQLGAWRGLMVKPQKSAHNMLGGIIETPILANFREGLGLGDYFISTHGARKGLSDTAVKTADAGYTSRKLVEVAQNITITQQDCQTMRGFKVSSLYDNEGITYSLAEQIEGRTALKDIKHPTTQAMLVGAGEQITQSTAQKIEHAGIEEVEIRSALTCETQYGICAKCYGKDLATNKEAQIGQAVGIVAAHSLAEPATQLTLRTFHAGGTSSNVAVKDDIKATLSGMVRFDNLIKALTTNNRGEQANIVINKTAEICIVNPKTQQELASYHIPYGAYLRVDEGQQVQKNQQICYWDSYNIVILTQVSGRVAFEHIEEGVTYKTEYDDQTGYNEKIIIAPKDKNKHPKVIVHHKEGQKAAYNIPVEASLLVEEGSQVHAGQILAKIPRAARQSTDITTGGLPYVTGLFEARNPANSAILAAIEGIVTYGKVKRGNREITIKAKDGTQKTYLVPTSKHILVQDGEYVTSGAHLSDGLINIADILAIEGPAAAQRYVMSEIQAVYLLQGVKINNKHIEIILRQMMQKVEVVSSGDTVFTPRELVDKLVFKQANEALLDKKIITKVGGSSFSLGQLVTESELEGENAYLSNNKLDLAESRSTQPAIAQPKIKGITQTAVKSESFLAAASFQETAKVLSAAAVAGRSDKLRGLKENVIIGNLIPAGTGRKVFQNLIVTSKETYKRLLEEREAFEEEQTYNKQASSSPLSCPSQDQLDNIKEESPDNPEQLTS